MDVGKRPVKRAAHGYEATREAAMAAFAKSWRRTIGRVARADRAGLADTDDTKREIATKQKAFIRSNR